MRRVALRHFTVVRVFILQKSAKKYKLNVLKRSLDLIAVKLLAYMKELACKCCYCTKCLQMWHLISTQMKKEYTHTICYLKLSIKQPGDCLYVQMYKRLKCTNIVRKSSSASCRMLEIVRKPSPCIIPSYSLQVYLHVYHCTYKFNCYCCLFNFFFQFTCHYFVNRSSYPLLQ